MKGEKAKREKRTSITTLNLSESRNRVSRLNWTWRLFQLVSFAEASGTRTFLATSLTSSCRRVIISWTKSPEGTVTVGMECCCCFCCITDLYMEINLEILECTRISLTSPSNCCASLSMTSSKSGSGRTAHCPFANKVYGKKYGLVGICA